MHLSLQSSSLINEIQSNFLCRTQNPNTVMSELIWLGPSNLRIIKDDIWFKHIRFENGNKFTRMQCK